MNHKTIAKNLGVTINYKKDPNKYCNWDGKQANALGVKEQDLIHELSHWSVAPPMAKSLPDYGLGPLGPSERYRKLIYNTKGINNKRIYKRKNSKYEEELACVIEFCYSAISKDLPYMRSLMKERNFAQKIGLRSLRWSNNPEIDLNYFLGLIDDLIEKDLIDCYWAPMALIEKDLIKSHHRKNLKSFRRMIYRIKT
jgi:hypothetical protein